jgi:hypothetical protein
MKKLIAVLFAVSLVKIAVSQNTSGIVVTKIINSAYLQNTGGENPDRRISVYLPPGYDQSQQRYPVVYYLHGFMGTDSITPYMKNILDIGIPKNKIRPFILVIADNFTLFSGSFYSNSTLTGNWSDFEAKNLLHIWIKISEPLPTVMHVALAAIQWVDMGH